MSFFFIPTERCTIGEMIEISGSTAHRLLAVRRYKKGDKIEIQDKSKNRFEAEISESDTRKLVLKTISAKSVPKNPVRKICIICAYISENALDIVLQKCTELGAENVNIFRAQFSPNTPKKDRLAHKIDRWNAIAISACEQSGRSEPPKITFFNSLREVISAYKKENLNTEIICLDQNSKDKIPMLNTPLGICVGPEGGWSEEEKKLLETMGIEKKSIGQHTLRAETASVSAAAIALNI